MYDCGDDTRKAEVDSKEELRGQVQVEVILRIEDSPK